MPEMGKEAIPVTLRLAITRQGDPFLWPLKMPGSNRKADRWFRSAISAANLAEKNWVRVVSNMSNGGYDILKARGNLSEPVWPDMIFRDYLELAFRDRRIDSVDHEILKSLRGEI